MLKLNCIEKKFPGVKALDGVSFEVAPGSIHALIGENGAGKSTLCKIIAGAYSPDGGKISFDNQEIIWQSPGEARKAGIHIIYQEFVLFPNMNVAENIFFGYEHRNSLGLIDHKKNYQEALNILNRLGVSIDLDIPVKFLSVADQQMLEIAKALAHEVKLLILDEPTAVISGAEVELLFDIVRQLQSQGVSVLYISHRLEEIFSLCEKVTVLKDGRHIETKDVEEIGRDQLVSLMVGRELSKIFPKKKANNQSKKILEVNDLSVPSKISKVSLELYRGEILGIAGLIGAGRTELAQAIMGFLKVSHGSVSIDGVKLENHTVRSAIDAGIGYLTEDRKSLGLFMNLTIDKNVTAAKLSSFADNFVIKEAREKECTKQIIDRLSIACRGTNSGVDNLSGGNQQKVMLGRWIEASKKVLILDEPTRGVDVGAKVEIYHLIREMANSGIGIIMISSELPEILGMSDRVLVMREGMISGELSGNSISEEAIMDLSVHLTKTA